MGMDQEAKVHCIGGCSFFHLALGIFVLLPSTIVLALFASDETWTSSKLTGVIMFSIGLLILLVGLILIIYWCSKTKTGGELKDPEASSNKNGTRENNLDV